VQHAEPGADNLLRTMLIDEYRIPVARQHIDGAPGTTVWLIAGTQPVGTRVGAVSELLACCWLIRRARSA